MSRKRKRERQQDPLVKIDAWRSIVGFLPRHALLNVSQCSKALDSTVRDHHRSVQADLSCGIEDLPVPVENSIDDERYPSGFVYGCVTRGTTHLPEPLPRQVAVAVFKDRVKGWSLRAPEPIPPNTFIGEYVGRLVRTQDMDRSSTYIVSIREEASDVVWRTNVDARFVGNFTRFINHSCDPNARWETYRSRDSFCPRIHVLSLRHIQAGEEITVDYGLAHGLGASKCGCQSPNCGGFLPFDSTL
ncbi:unnamed protein product [Aphanomyces euteiches]